MNTALIKSTSLLLAAIVLVFSLSIVSFAANGFKYEHDPKLNPSAMEDVVEDENAVYGFRPSETGSLKAYAAYDWSDSAIVEKGRQDRIAYHESLSEMYELLAAMTSEGKDIETIARVLSAKRNELRLAAYKDDPEGLAQVKARNLEQYGHEEGPLPDELFVKYKSWEAVLKKAFNTNSGMDACLGLYDDYYALYVASGEVRDVGAPQAGDSQTAIVIAAAASLLFAGAVAAAHRKRMTDIT